jgi:2-polyprenyl-3-methyl-5-hydroxy-6-metoxy-1,4-benzoquinol methylase
MEDLFEHERQKYNVIHKYTGIDEGQVGYGRQLGILLTGGDPFHRKWQELYKEGNSFLEVGLGAGEIIKHFHKESVNYCGVDISDYVVDELVKLGLNAKQMSSHDLTLDNETYDVVQHLDGLEHIPVKWELDTLKEELRVSKKYVFHSNAMGDAYLDTISKQHGFDALHINIKNEQQWDEFYQFNTDLGYNILLKDVTPDTYRIILEK